MSNPKGRLARLEAARKAKNLIPLMIWANSPEPMNTEGRSVIRVGWMDEQESERGLSD